MNNTIEVTLNGLEGGEEALSSMHGLGEAPLNATDANTMSPSAVGDYVGDVIKGIANGPVNSVNETIDLAGTILNGGEEVDVAKATKGSGWFTDMSNFGETQTSAGKFAEDISTFVSGFVTGGKLLEGIKVLQGAGKGARAARDVTKSFYSTVTSFDEHDSEIPGLAERAYGNPLRKQKDQ